MSPQLLGRWEDIDINRIHFNPALPHSEKGEFSTLYTGLDPGTGVFCALKRLRGGPGNARDFKRIEHKAEVWTSIQHPNVLPFLGVLPKHGGVFLVSPYETHGSVDHWLKSNPGAPRDRIIYDVTKGLAHLHEKGIIHGDIKASNVLITASLNATLCDFGLEDHHYAIGNHRFDPLGGIRLRSPELLSGAVTPGTTQAADVYAYAMLISEILSGRIPFHELKGLAAIIAAIESGRRPVKEPTASSTGASYTMFWDIAEQCWAPLPTSRPSMASVVRELQSAGGTQELGTLRPVASVAQSDDRPASWASNIFIVTWLVAVLLVWGSSHSPFDSYTPTSRTRSPLRK